MERSVLLRTALPSLSAVVATVTYADGGTEGYHLPIGHDRGLEARQLTDRVPDAVIHETKGPDGGPFYDAARDERLGGVYLDLLSRAANVEELRFYRMEWTGTLPGPGRPLTSEQSSTPGLRQPAHPQAVPPARAGRERAGGDEGAGRGRLRGLRHPARLIEGLGSTLGILQRFYAGSLDGWTLATRRVGDHYASEDGDPGNFAGDAAALGRVTAELHAAMAAALPKATEGQPDLGRLSARLLGQLSQVAELVPELAGQRQAIEEVYAKAEVAGGGTVTRSGSTATTTSARS